MNKFLGIALVLLGLSLAIVPNLTDCASRGAYMNVMGKQIPMVCHWSARSEMIAGIPLVFFGGIMTFTRHKTGLLTIVLLGLVLGVLALMLPLHIIGTCPGPAMTCNTLMKPIIILLGSLIIAASVIGGLVFMRKAGSDTFKAA